MTPKSVNVTVRRDRADRASISLQFDSNVCGSTYNGTELFYSESPIAADVSYTTANDLFGRIFVDLKRFGTESFSIRGFRNNAPVTLRVDVLCADENGLSRAIRLQQVVDL